MEWDGKLKEGMTGIGDRRRDRWRETGRDKESGEGLGLRKCGGTGQRWIRYFILMKDILGLCVSSGGSTFTQVMYLSTNLRYCFYYYYISEGNIVLFTPLHLSDSFSY